MLSNPFEKDKEPEFYEKLYLYDGSIRTTIEKLRAASKNFMTNMAMIEELFHLLFMEIVTKQKEIYSEILKVPAIRNTTKQELYKRLTKAKDLIDSCYSSEMTLSDIAKVSFLNDAYLLRQFKKLYNTTPRQYQILKRMTAAKKAIESEDMSITEICRHVGYSDLVSFSKLFKRLYNCSPENYRLSLKNKSLKARA
jgi:AraC-like DNA-binding protein